METTAHRDGWGLVWRQQSFPVVSHAAVPVLCVVRGETRHPDPADRGQNRPGQQHSLHHPLPAPADRLLPGKRRPGEGLNGRSCFRPQM